MDKNPYFHLALTFIALIVPENALADQIELTNLELSNRLYELEWWTSTRLWFTGGIGGLGFLIALGNFILSIHNRKIDKRTEDFNTHFASPLQDALSDLESSITDICSVISHGSKNVRSKNVEEIWKEKCVSSIANLQMNLRRIDSNVDVSTDHWQSLIDDQIDSFAGSINILTNPNATDEELQKEKTNIENSLTEISNKIRSEIIQYKKSI